MSKVVVIGGGIVGLMSAYYLNQSGHQVTVIEKSDFTKTCSYGNAGLIVPSHIIPLAAPGMISMGLKWMFNPGSPFGFKPSLSKDLISWIWKFYKSSNKTHVDKSKIPLRDFNLLSKELYQELSKSFDFHLKNTGILLMFKTEEAGRHEIETGIEARHLGLDIEILNGKEVQEIEQIETNVAGAVYFKCDSHIYPGKLLTAIIDHLKDNNTVILDNTEILNFELKNGKITTVITKDKIIEADYFVLSGGMWSNKLSRKLNINIPLQSGKGYSITLQNFKNPPKYPSLLLETRAAVTPMGNDLRLAGTMELGSNNDKINFKRVKGYLSRMKDYYPGIDPIIPNAKEIWFGHRPCSPDGLPYIGKSDKFDNLVYATGHAMMGLSLGPATGKLVQEIIDDKKTSVDLTPFNPERYN
ncbi:MAG: FAD-dependent oxidoreductase [Bacteroidetes bacterium]|nr:FAD-dependent oxidoreductase [Bacteroidota bacterium]